MKKAKKVIRWQLIFMRTVPVMEKILICDKDLLLPHCIVVIVSFKKPQFYWNFVLRNTLGVQFLVKLIGNSGCECVTFF